MIKSYLLGIGGHCSCVFQYSVVLTGAMSSDGSNYVSDDSVSGEQQYLPQLWVFKDGEDQQEGSSGSTTNYKKIKDAIGSLTFREPPVLVQYWSLILPHGHRLLTTSGQPYGLGIVDEGLYYRRESERRPCVVDEEHKEEHANRLARVFRRGLPEWNLNVANYSAKHYPLQDFAVRCNIHGSLVLPIFGRSSGECVGVLETVMSSKYPDYAYEVQEVHSALKGSHLYSPRVFGDPNSHVATKHRRDELHKILGVLKLLCESYNLPLAQTWTVTGIGSIVAHKGSLVDSCSSFKKRCIGKVCMSTTNLPFYVWDLKKWNFWRACTQRHLEKSRGVVGRALFSRGSCFCGDVTKLGKDEYPLVRLARKYKLTCCFAVYLHSIEGDGEYVIEFFLPKNITVMPDSFVETVKQQIENDSGMKLGSISRMEVIGVSLNCNLESTPFPKASLIGGGQIPVGMENLMSEQKDVPINYNETQNLRTVISSQGNLVENHVDNSQGRKRQRTAELVNLEESKQQFGMTVEEPIANVQVGQSRLEQDPHPSGILRNPDISDVHAMLTASLIIQADGLDNVPSIRGMEDKKTVTIKAAYKGDMIKFQFPLLSRLSELKDEVAERINLQSGSFHINYIDEDNDRILIACDADLQNLFSGASEISNSNSTIKLIIRLADI